MTTKPVCAKTIYDGTYRGHPCSRKPTVTVGGLAYCTIHAPDNVKARTDARRDRWRKRTDTKIAQSRHEVATQQWLAECGALVEKLAATRLDDMRYIKREADDLFAKRPRRDP